jgi:hypothetical protein
MTTVKINDGNTEIEIAEGSHVFCKNGGVDEFMEWNDLQPDAKEIILKYKAQTEKATSV